LGQKFIIKFTLNIAIYLAKFYDNFLAKNKKNKFPIIDELWYQY